jgi:Zn-finger nucleic acid-binding protein
MANCPICSGEFLSEEIKDVTVAICNECDGVWLEPGDFDRITDQDVEFDFDSWMEAPTECRYCRTPLGFGTECGHCGKLPTIHCPLGHGVMNATLVEIADREFEIDHCPSCRGIWIDGHEIDHLDAVAPTQQRSLPSINTSRSSGAGAAIGVIGSMVVLDALAGGHMSYGRRSLLRRMTGRSSRAPGPMSLVLIVVGIVFALYRYFGPSL